MAKQGTSDPVKKESDGDAVESLNRALEGLGARIDGLLVQFDLAGDEVRDRVRANIDLTENVYLAARSRLVDVPRDASVSLKTFRGGVEKLIQDLQAAFEAAEAAFRRGRED